MKRTLISLSSYALTTAITGIAAFLAIPLLIRTIGEEEFGRWSLIEPLVMFAATFALLGTNWGAFKLIARDQRLPGSVFAFLWFYSQPVTWVTAGVIAIVLATQGHPVAEALLIALTTFVEASLLLWLAVSRAADWAGVYLTTQVVKAAAFLGLIALAFHGLYGLVSVQDVLILRAATAGGALALGMLLAVRSNGSELFMPSRSPLATGLYADAVGYGVPLLLTALLTQGMDFIPRLVISAFADYSLVAHFVVYTKLVAILYLGIIAPFSLWWATERFRRLRDQDGGEAFFRRVAFVILAVLLTAGGLVWLLIPRVLPLFAPGIPVRQDIELPLIIAMISTGMAYPLNIGLLNEGCTRLNIFGALVGIAIVASLCLALLPRYGLLGVAWASCAGCLGYTTVLALLSQRVYPVQFDYVIMSILVAAAGGLLVIAYFLSVEGIWGLIVQTIFFLVSMTAFTSALWIRVRRRVLHSVGPSVLAVDAE